jgi:hypothetical protein
MGFGPLMSRAPALSSSPAMWSTSASSAAQNAIRFSLAVCPGLSVIPNYAADGGRSVVANTFHSGPS